MDVVRTLDHRRRLTTVSVESHMLLVLQAVVEHIDVAIRLFLLLSDASEHVFQTLDLGRQVVVSPSRLDSDRVVYSHQLLWEQSVLF